MVDYRADYYGTKRNVHSGRSPSLNPDEIDKICKYLENPTKIGFWSLKGKWKTNEGISEYICSELINEFKDKDEIQIQSGRRQISLKEEDKEEIFSRINNKMTFVFNIFTYLYYSENKPLKPVYFYRVDEIIYDMIDTQKLKEKYSDAYEYFKTNIYFEGFEPKIVVDTIIRIKDGLFILTDLSHESEKLSIISMDSSNLEKINIFLTKLGKVSDCKITPIFSPEETVFSPYFSLLGVAYPYFIDEENVKRLFEKSINEYRDGNHSYCVSTIGLIAEDYLTQIYETFYRDVCPKRLTLGQTFDLINNKLKQEFQVQSNHIPEINHLYGRIEKINKDLINGEESEIFKEILKLIREILYCIQKEKKYTRYLIENRQKKKENNSSNISVFPDYLTENVKELIRYRNATSHNSRIPIFNYEALRTVYCCITLVMWWINEKNKIDWEDDQETILKKSIERNTGITLIE